MDAAWLAEQLEAGRSIESIARETGRDPSTVAYWVNKYGLASAARAKARRPWRDRPRRADGAGRNRQVDPNDCWGARRERDDGPSLAREVRASNRGRGAAVRNLAPARGRTRVQAPRLDDVGAIGAWALPLQAVPDRGRERPSAARQGDPRRRGRRRMPALRLLAVRGSAAVSPRRPDREGVRAVESRAGALAGEGSGGGHEVRAPVRQLPCGSRGGGRYYWRLESPTPISRFTVVQYTGRG